MSGKKTGLGRGLSALLESNELEEAPKEVRMNQLVGSVSLIPIDDIETNPFQPRTDFDRAELADLAMSIQHQGIIQPVTVRKLSDGRFQLISGERRLKAARVAGLMEIPAYIRVANDEQMLEMALVENIQREDLNPVEIAISFQRLMEECQIRQEDLSQRVGKDRSTISNYIRLLRLPAVIQLALREKKISMGHARALITIEDPSRQVEFLNRILAENTSVREVEEMVREKKTAKTGISRKKPSILPERFQRIQQTLHDKLDTPVNLHVKRNGSGQITITFDSEKKLKEIIARFEQPSI